MEATKRTWTSWLSLIVTVVFVISLAAAWKWTALSEWAEPERWDAIVGVHRERWYTPFLVVAVFVVAELVMFPVLVLVFVCGIVFGPWVGTLYALAGSVISALPPFFAGRRLGREKLERWLGEPVRRLDKALEKRGIVAVFVVRKIPAPYSLVNLICGACGVRARDFVLGTLLGMSTGVILITVIGGQLGEVLRDPEPRQIATAIGLLLLPITLALVLQRKLNRRAERGA